MATANEELAALEMKVSELIGILINGFSASEDDATEVSRIVGQYAQQVEEITLLAGAAGFLGLHDVGMLFRESLQRLGDQGKLSEEERNWLEEWSVLVVGYLTLPTDPQTSEALIEHLQGVASVCPLAEADAAVLKDLFTLCPVPIAPQVVSQPHSSSDSSAEKTGAAGKTQTTHEGTAQLEREIADKAPEQTAPTKLTAEIPLTEKALSISESHESTPEETEATERHSPPIVLPSNFSAVNTVDALKQEIAELAGILMDAPWENTGAEVFSQLWERYSRQVERIGTAASAAGLHSLQHNCVLFQKVLERLNNQARPVSEDERVWLEEWPALVMGYLESNHEVEAERALAKYLENPFHCDDLPADDGDASVEEEFTPQITAEFLYDTQSTTSTDALIVTTPDSEEETRCPEEETLAQEEVQTSISPSLMRSAGLAEEETLAQKEMETSTIATDLDETGQELVEILRSEVERLVDSLEELLPAAGGESSEAGPQVLESYAEAVERLGEASGLVGLQGLQQVCRFVHAQLLNLSTRESCLTPDERAILLDWPAQVLAYLQSLHDRSICETLVKHLQDCRWPGSLPADQAQALVDSLVAASVAVQEETPARLQHSRLEDISLALPEDVHPELLESLLQELPQQTADFSASIQRLNRGVGTLEDVGKAQRVAHTLKGAANTVGVRGIASLTHHLEDILLALSKHQVLPTAALNQTLTNAADCLENISEALLGLSDPPSNPEMLGILQEVLDWANLIDLQGIPTGEDRPQINKSLPQPSERASELATAAETPSQPIAFATAEVNGTAPQAAAVPPATATLRVPATLIDELLRLAGESIILNGQLQDRLQRTILQTQAVREQNRALQQLTAELEQLVDIQGITSPTAKDPTKGEFDPLELDQYHELHTLSRRLVEAAADGREMNHDIEDNLMELSNLLINQRRLHQENEEAAMRTRMVPVKTVIPRLQRSVRRSCQLTDKEVELYVDGDDTLMDSNILNELVDPLMHVLRNAVDHGIEYPEIRLASGKQAKGSIHLSFLREGSNIVVRCSDDGAGLDSTRIRAMAEKQGLIKPEQTLTEDDLIRLILMPGFSTRTQATQVSGRGIGLDAVFSRTRELKGSLRLHSQPVQGCRVELKLPITLTSTRGLLVHAGKQVFALAARGIEQILYSDSGKTGKIGGQITYQQGDEIYKAVTLESLLHLPSDPIDHDRKSRPTLLIRDESGGSHVMLVQDVIDSRDLVVKSMGQYLPKLRGVLGATILGDGSVSPVLDLPELLQTTMPAYPEPVAERREAPAITNWAAPCALIVDDSLSARRALAQFAEDAGYEVRTAIDGLEAVAILETKRPDILLVDLEMPRMNGLELTSHVRNQKATQDLPVIMITSRTTEKHRREAKAAGVDVCLSKPFSEDELLGHIKRLTAMRGVA